MKSLKDNLFLFLKGVSMGSADVVPGVSGGSIALITGIYEELLKSINSCDAQAIKLVFALKFKDFWKHINGQFLLPLLSGIALSIFTLAKVISYILENHPIQMWSFFFGLIIISSISVAKEVKKWNLITVVIGLMGVTIAYGVTVITPAQTTNELWFIFLSGAIAICAMILPGISGSFILLLLGKYKYIMTSVKDLDILTIVVFAIGCITGLLTFSRVISFLLKKYHDYAIALLSGFMIGSLNKIWPWKKPVLFEVIHDKQVPVLEKNILPSDYLEITGNNPLLIHAILFMALGFMIIVIIEKIALALKK